LLQRFGEVVVGDLQVVLGSDGLRVADPLADDACMGKSSANSVSRVLRRFWNSLGHRGEPTGAAAWFGERPIGEFDTYHQLGGPVFDSSDTSSIDHLRHIILVQQC